MAGSVLRVTDGTNILHGITLVVGTGLSLSESADGFPQLNISGGTSGSTFYSALNILAVNPSGARELRFVDNGTTQYNWRAGTAASSNDFEITPSTATGGLTFTSPVLLVRQAGTVELPVGNLKFSGTSQKIIASGTQLAIRNAGDSADNILITDAGAVTFRSTVNGITTLTATTLAGTLSTAAQTNVTSLGTLTGLTIGGDLTFSGVSRRVIAGTTDFSIRDSGNANDNLLITDAGAASIRSTLTVGTSLGTTDALQVLGSARVRAASTALAAGTLVGAYGGPVFDAMTRDVVSADAAATTAVTTSTQNSVAWSHTISGTAVNRLLIVGVALRETDGSGVNTVQSVTYGAQNLQQLTASTRAGARAELWYLVAPNTGTATVTVTVQGGATNVDRFTAGAICYNNVDQLFPFGTASVANGSSTTASVAVTAVTGDLVIDVLAKQTSTEAITPDATQSQLWNVVTVAGGDVASNRERGGASTKTGSGSVTMQWTWPTTARNWAIIGVPIKPAATAKLAVNSAGDTVMNLLGVFDNTAAPATGNLLVYGAGGTTKWAPANIQLSYGTSDTKVGLGVDSTAYSYIEDATLAGTGSNPATPVNLRISIGHLSNTLDWSDSSTTNVVRYRVDYSTSSSFASFTSVYTTSLKFVHSRLDQGFSVGTNLYYRVSSHGAANTVTVAAGGPYTALTTNGSFCIYDPNGDTTIDPVAVTRNSEATAFGSVIAAEIAVANLAAISADIGKITGTAVIQDSDDVNTRSGIRFKQLVGVSALPSGWTDNPTAAYYLDFDSPTGSKEIVHFGTALRVYASGSAVFSGGIDASYIKASEGFETGGSYFTGQANLWVPAATKSLIVQSAGTWTDATQRNLGGSAQNDTASLGVGLFDNNVVLWDRTFDATATSATAGPPGTLTDTNSKWPPNQFVGAEVKIVSGTGNGTNWYQIASNTATTLTISGAWANGTPASGSVYQIRGVVNGVWGRYTVTIGGTPSYYSDNTNYSGGANGAAGSWPATSSTAQRSTLTAGTTTGTAQVNKLETSSSLPSDLGQYTVRYQQRMNASTVSTTSGVLICAGHTIVEYSTNSTTGSDGSWTVVKDRVTQQSITAGQTGVDSGTLEYTETFTISPANSATVWFRITSSTVYSGSFTASGAGATTTSTGVYVSYVRTTGAGAFTRRSLRLWPTFNKHDDATNVFAPNLTLEPLSSLPSTGMMRGDLIMIDGGSAATTIPYYYDGAAWQPMKANTPGTHGRSSHTVDLVPTNAAVSVAGDLNYNTTADRFEYRDSVGTRTLLRREGDTMSGALTVSSGGITVSTGTTAVQALTATTASLSSTLTFTAAASKIIPGATSLSHRNAADNADNLLITDAGAVTTRQTLTVTAGGLTVSAGTTAVQALTATTASLSSTLTFTAAASKIIPGATSLSHRNAADNADNLLITDAGAVTLRSSLGGVTTLNTSGLITTTGGIDISGGTAAAGRIVTTAASGTVIRGKAGSSTDFLLENKNGTDVLSVATGTTTLQFTGTLNGTGTTSAIQFLTHNLGTNYVLQTSVSGDSANRFNATVNGVLTWGPGNAAQDTNLYRGSANVLQTDYNFSAVGWVRSTGTGGWVLGELASNARITYGSGEFSLLNEANGNANMSAATVTANTLKGVGFDANARALIWRSSGTGNTFIGFGTTAGSTSYIGIPGATNGLTNGSAVDDLVIRGDTKNILFTTDGGGSIAMKIDTSGNVTLKSLGTFDGSDTPNDGDVLFYRGGATGKWQAEHVEYTVGTNDFKATINTSDGTAVAYVLETLSPADGAVNTPGTPTVTAKHLSFELRIPGTYVKTANFKRFKWEVSVNDAGTPSYTHVIYSTSLNIVHARLTAASTYRYRVRAESTTTVSAFSGNTGNQSCISGSDTEAFGGIVAGNIAAVDIAALTGDFGIMKAGRLQDTFASPTSMINLGGRTGGIPSTVKRLINFENTTLPTWTSGQSMVWVNLNPTANSYFLRHDKFGLDYNGGMQLPVTVVLLTSGTSWGGPIPSDFNPFMNMIEAVGGGGGGAAGTSNSAGGGGGGGGEYRRIVAFNNGGLTSVTYAIGGGGSGATSSGGTGGTGGDTTWNGTQLVAKGGTGGAGTTNGSGQSTGTGVDPKVGGNGGVGQGGGGARSGGGGGGAAGAHANGSNGSAAAAGSPGTFGAGGAGGGPSGGTGGSTSGANGGNATGSGTAAGRAGGGGAGRTGSEVTAAGNGGLYGGGGGGGASSAGSFGNGGSGAQGCITITYFPIGQILV